MIKNSISTLIIIIITLLLLEIVLRVLTKEDPPGYEFFLNKPWRYVLPFQPEFSHRDTSSTGKYGIYHPKLGWDIGKSGVIAPLYYSNHKGLRCSKSDYSSKYHENKDSFDIICIGDSFTHGDAVNFEDTWTYQLGVISGKSTLNLGVGGYGIDQATLKLKEKLEHGYYADTVILGLIAGDLDRALFTVYNFYSGGDKTKPKFIFENNAVSVVNQPCAVNESLRQEYDNFKTSEVFNQNPGFTPSVFERSFWDYSYFWRLLKSSIHQRANRKSPVYIADDERLSYCLNILKYLKNICDERRIHLVVLILGNNNTFSDRKTIEKPWHVLEGKLRQHNIDMINADDYQYAIYTKDKHKIIHPTEGIHYSEEGHRILADFLKTKLF